MSELPLAQAGGGTAGTRPAEAVSVVPAAWLCQGAGPW